MITHKHLKSTFSHEPLAKNSVSLLSNIILAPVWKSEQYH